MESETLHILNGDDTLRAFNETGLEGDTLVWREVLSEGPVANQLQGDFWKTRAAWITTTFGDADGGYLNWEATELSKINDPYSEINLWFEFDLHCQVNMLGVMQLLKQQTDLSERAVYLICPDSVPGVQDFRGMGQLNGEQLEYLFDGRVQLTEYDFKLADEAWQLYVAADAEKLKNWIETNPFWGSLHMLKRAMEAHLKRLEINDHGHNDIERKLLYIHKSGTTHRRDIYHSFWSMNKIYGMGDKELDIYLDRLGLY